MALRLPKAGLPAELEEKMIEQLGATPENVEVLWHSPEVTQDNLEFGGKVGAWGAADASLKSFAVFTPLERDVPEYAEAMTNTPPTVTDELYATLLDRLITFRRAVPSYQ